MPEFEWNAGIEMPVTPFTPFSTIKNKFANTPGAHSRMTLGAESVLSPTFKEERALEKSEKETEKQQAQDLVSRQFTAQKIVTFVYLHSRLLTARSSLHRKSKLASASLSSSSATQI